MERLGSIASMKTLVWAPLSVIHEISNLAQLVFVSYSASLRRDNGSRATVRVAKQMGNYLGLWMSLERGKMQETGCEDCKKIVKVAKNGGKWL